MYIQDDRNTANEDAVANPQPGDYWHEMFCPYFLVVKVDGDEITVLSCLGGPSSFNRKDEINAKVDNQDGTWSFDYSKSMIVDRAWIRRTVKYGTIDGFVADVVRGGNKEEAVKEWIRYRAEQLMSELKKLGPEVSKYLLTL